MTRKRIIMIAAAGLISFSGAFVLAWLTTKPAPISQAGEPNQAILATSNHIGEPAEEGLPPPETSIATDGQTKKTMTEKQLESLVYDVREKIQNYNSKLQDLEVREQRLQVTQETLKKDIETLNNLRIELASIVANLKAERDKLLKSRVEISQAEKANLISIAATYDKMDAGRAGEILSNMCASQTKQGDIGELSSSFNDAVKILHYMTERTKAKVLAELVASQPKLAAMLCERLKQIVEIK